MAKCPKCGNDDAYLGLASVECPNAGCALFSQKQHNSVYGAPISEGSVFDDTRARRDEDEEPTDRIDVSDLDSDADLKQHAPVDKNPSYGFNLIGTKTGRMSCGEPRPKNLSFGLPPFASARPPLRNTPADIEMVRKSLVEALSKVPRVSVMTVTCDETNNSPEDIAAGRLNATIAFNVAPKRERQGLLFPDLDYASLEKRLMDYGHRVDVALAPLPIHDEVLIDARYEALLRADLFRTISEKTREPVMMMIRRRVGAPERAEPLHVDWTWPFRAAENEGEAKPFSGLGD